MSDDLQEWRIASDLRHALATVEPADEVARQLEEFLDENELGLAFEWVVLTLADAINATSEVTLEQLATIASALGAEHDPAWLGMLTFERLRADLAPLGNRYTLTNIPPSTGEFRALPGGRRQRGLWFGGVDISSHGTVSRVVLEFPDPANPDALRQLLNQLDQAQDHIIEEEGAAWPTCPGHKHPLELTIEDKRIAWTCPETGRILAWFGCLGASGA